MILFNEISNFVSYSSTQLHLGMLLHKLSMQSYLITLIYFNDGFGFVCGILTNQSGESLIPLSLLGINSIDLNGYISLYRNHAHGIDFFCTIILLKMSIHDKMDIQSLYKYDKNYDSCSIHVVDKILQI